jgi:chemotaxis protein methyltransferase CheR
MTAISDAEFTQFQHFIYQHAGINLASSKKGMVVGRLAKRLAHCGVETYAEYFRLLNGRDAGLELQTAIDLLTTNETYFFREPKHFEFLKKQIRSAPAKSHPLRIWSAAGSTGEEAYSIAMLLEDLLPGGSWEVLASDISTRVLERARRGHYSTARTENIPTGYLRRFCLKGHGEAAGTLLITRALRSKVRFIHVNLTAPLPQIGAFDVVFLRNVLIYFDIETKRKVVERVVATLRPGGWLLIGHSETLGGVSEAVEAQAPSIYRKPS